MHWKCKALMCIEVVEYLLDYLIFVVPNLEEIFISISKGYITVELEILSSYPMTFAINVKQM